MPSIRESSRYLNVIRVILVVNLIVGLVLLSYVGAEDPTWGTPAIVLSCVVTFVLLRLHGRAVMKGK